LIVGLSYLHVPIYFQLNTLQRICVPSRGIYQIFFGVWSTVTFSLGPPVIMLVSGSLTIRHTRQTVRRIVAHNIQTQTITVPQPRQRRNGTDRQLIQMMLVQCAVFTVTATPTSINYIYTSVRSNVAIDALQKAKDNFLLNIVGIISATSSYISFYLFVLSSHLFRSELKHL
jgi:hypothetical protein